MTTPDIEITDTFVEEQVGRQRWYWLLLLSIGPARAQTDDEVEAIQAAHLRHMFTLRSRGQLMLFGPVQDVDPLRGIGVLTVETRAEAEGLMADDPAVLAGRLVAAVRPWLTMPGDKLPG